MNERIKWVDYFKAITIILVVVGHATGLFCSYIYQFHVASFFFISGYTSKLNQKKFFEVLFQRFMTIIVPYTVLGIIGVSVIYVINTTGQLGRVSTVTDIDTLNGLISSIYGYLRCDWLGASWFLLALFAGIIIQRIILLICKDKINVLYCILSVGLCGLAYYWRSIGSCPVPVRNFTLYAFAQYYIFLGIVIAELPKKFKEFSDRYDVVISMAGLMFSGMLLYINANVFGWSMGLDCLYVNNIFVDTYLVINGVIFVWSIAHLLGHIPFAWFEYGLSMIGKNTLGILFIHFCGFKICTAILVLFGKASWADIAPLCPPAYLSNAFWWLYTVVAILISVIIWELLKNIRIINMLLGMDREKNQQLYQKLK